MNGLKFYDAKIYVFKFLIPQKLMVLLRLSK